MESAARKARNAKQLSIEEAAKQLGISAGYLSQIEKGQRQISAVRAREISKLYGVEEKEIFSASRFVICEERGIG